MLALNSKSLHFICIAGNAHTKIMGGGGLGVLLLTPKRQKYSFSLLKLKIMKFFESRILHLLLGQEAVINLMVLP